MKLETQNSYVSNPQFTGGTVVTPVAGNTFLNSSETNPAIGFVAGGLYIGSIGDLTAKTVDGSTLTFVSASGFIPGIFTAVSASSTATDVIALK